MARKLNKGTKDFLKELEALIESGGKTGLMSKILEIGIQKLIEIERDNYIGAGSYERVEHRKTYRNGYKPRKLATRVGELSLQVPQTRDGGFYPQLLERYQRSERALVLSLVEAYVNGVSTRKMKKITEELVGKDFSSMSISRYASELDSELEQWRERSLDDVYPYVIIDARYDKCRISSRITDIAVFTAIGIDTNGYRRILSVSVDWGENNTSWEEFIGGLKKRGLREVRLFTSDNHSGIRHAIRKHFPGSSWQRCQWHFLQNAKDKVPKRYQEQVQEELKDVWSSHSWAQAKGRLEEMAERWAGEFSQFSDFLSEEGWATLTVYNVCPKEHRKKLRTSNMIERVNEEFKRRGRVVRIFPNPESCLRLYSAIAKEWDEDWMSGKKYMTMDPLWRWEKENIPMGEALAPLPSDNSMKDKQITVA